MAGMGVGVETKVERRMPIGEEVRVIFVVSSMSVFTVSVVQGSSLGMVGRGYYRR